MMGAFAERSCGAFVQRAENWAGQNEQVQEKLSSAVKLCASFKVLSFHPRTDYETGLNEIGKRIVDQKYTDVMYPWRNQPSPCGKGCPHSPEDRRGVVLFAGEDFAETGTAFTREAYDMYVRTGYVAIGPPGRWDLLVKKAAFYEMLDSMGLTAFRPARYEMLAGRFGPPQWPCVLKPMASMTSFFTAASEGIETVWSAQQAWLYMCKHSKRPQPHACLTGNMPDFFRVGLLPGWELQEMVRGTTEWSTAMLVDRGTLVMHTTMVSCLGRDWGVYPIQFKHKVEAKRHPTDSSYFTVLSETFGVPPAVVHRASPAFYPTVEAILNATAVSGFVNVNYKVRPNGTPAIIEMNVGRLTGDLADSPTGVFANMLLEYARRAGACPPGTAAQRAEEEAATSESRRSAFKAGVANMDGVCRRQVLGKGRGIDWIYTSI